MLSISYHNLGVENEYVGRYEKACENHGKSILYLEEGGLENESIYIKFKNYFIIFCKVRYEVSIISNNEFVYY